MDPIDAVALTRSLVDIDSTTGREGEAGAWLARFLRQRGYDVEEQPVSDGRFNVFARARTSCRTWSFPRTSTASRRSSRAARSAAACSAADRATRKAYATDVPLLNRWGTPLLVGPGSIHVAHTDEEHVAVDELHHAVELYGKLARSLLASRGA